MITFDENLKIFSSSLINKSRLISGFGSKLIGDGMKLNNIFTFARNLDVDLNRIIIPKQIHSINIEVYQLKEEQHDLVILEDTDGVVTTEEKTMLVVRTADCAPVIYSDDVNGVIGISHNGWRGSVKRMAQKMIAVMVERGADIKKIKVAIGPSIGACCYDVPDERYYEFKAEFDGLSDKIFHTWKNKKHLDLSMLNYLLLLESGIEENNIDHFPFCTKCDSERFFSFRRDKKPEYGEMFSFILKYPRV